jgi:flagellar assembly protein FliH
MSSLPLDLLRGNGGFTRDPRFCALAPSRAANDPLKPEIDVEAEAFRRGFAEGSAQALQGALDAERERDARREAIELAFARFDEASAADLRERLRQTVLALCEDAVLPLAIDPEGLAVRIEKATAMLQRSQDERRVLLNPEDMKLVEGRLAAGLIVEADANVERGGLRIETPDGGIEDGPAHWRRVLAEAFGEC